MEIILNFFVENYLWFLIISLILIFGLIGYIVDAHEKRTPKLHFNRDTEINDEIVEETKSLKELLEDADDNENSDVMNFETMSSDDNKLNPELIKEDNQQESD